MNSIVNQRNNFCIFVTWAYIYCCVLRSTISNVFDTKVFYIYHITEILLLASLILNLSNRQFRKALFSGPALIWGVWALYSVINWFICPHFADTADQHNHYYWSTIRMFETYYLMSALYYEASSDFRKAIKLLFYMFSIYLILGLFGQAAGEVRTDDAWVGRNGTLLGNHFPLAMICSLFVATIARVYGYINNKHLIIWTACVVYVVLWVATRKAMLGCFILGLFFILANMKKLNAKNIVGLVFSTGLLYAAYDFVMANTLIGQRINQLQDYDYGVDVPVWLEFLGDRAMQYVLAWDVFLQHPINGVGLGNSMNYTYLPIPLHTEYMEQLCEGGIIGASLYLWFMFSMVKTIINSYKHRSPNVSIMCAGGVAMLLFISLTAWLYNMPHFFVVYGIILAYCRPLNKYPDQVVFSRQTSLFNK